MNMRKFKVATREAILRIKRLEPAGGLLHLEVTVHHVLLRVRLLLPVLGGHVRLLVHFQGFDRLREVF